MGIYYLDHYDGEEFYACAGCDTHLCNPERIVSKVSVNTTHGQYQATFSCSNSMGSLAEPTCFTKCKFGGVVQAYRYNYLSPILPVGWHTLNLLR